MTGRPKKFKTVKALQKLIDAYFDDCEANKKHVTLTGLALWLDTTRETLMDYQKNDEYSDTIKRAILRIENAYEMRLIDRGNGGDIFALKQFGWSDKHEVTTAPAENTRKAYLEAMAGMNADKMGEQQIQP